MLYDIRHKTTFSYEEVVSVSHHVLHLAPRRIRSQTCFESETIVEPEARRRLRRPRTTSAIPSST